jgi:hypothetical protein
MVEPYIVAEGNAAVAVDQVVAFALVGQRERCAGRRTHADVVEEVGLAVLELRRRADAE